MKEEEVTAQPKAAPDEPMPTQLREAFALGINIEVTPRGGEPVTLVIKPLYVDQCLATIDAIEKIYRLLNEKADEKGNVDMFEIFKCARTEVLDIIMMITEKDLDFIGRLELNDLVEVFAAIFNQNKDFFDQRVKGTLAPMLGQISSML